MAIRRIRGAASRGALVAALASALVLAMAGVAQASVSLDDSTPDAPSDDVTATGTVPEQDATHVAVAECNVEGLTDPEDFGTRCNAATASAFTAVGTYESSGLQITVEDAFFDFDFTTQSVPGTSSACAGTAGADQCAVVVSYYERDGTGDHWLGAEKVEIAFQ